jgi:NTP pyrophosphatase (non-canonical NTP hydrolase)
MAEPDPKNLTELRDRLREFAAARAWQTYHTPKNLVMALSVEVAELVEPFQWLTPEQSQALNPAQRQAVKEEIADVLIYLTRLADVLDIDPLAAAAEKLAINARKYPVETAYGNADKSQPTAS